MIWQQSIPHLHHNNHTHPGGAPGSRGFLASVDHMWRMNGQSAALAAHLAGASALGGAASYVQRRRFLWACSVGPLTHTALALACTRTCT